MNIDWVYRLVGMIVFSVIGLYVGTLIEKKADGYTMIYMIIGGIVGAILGLVLTPLITTKPARSVRRIMSKVPAHTLVMGLFGLVAGLIVGALLSIPLSNLPLPFGSFMPLVTVLITSYFGVVIFVARHDDILHVFRQRLPSKSVESVEGDGSTALQNSPANLRTILLDTSVIIDGRIGDVARTGFLVGSLLIPRFVLNELQYIADSPDNLRRQRGRRGMEVLAQLQKDASLPLKISDIDVDGVREVDEKLVVLARQMNALILTNDYNLNRVAELQGVTILNINDLANAVKSILLPGEVISIRIIQEGRESSQGIAYLDDGTMVVVEDGKQLIGNEATVTVTKVLQTSAGRMIFARLEEETH
jgi:uncharacterized protein YacL